MKTKMNRHVFYALATVAWADGELSQEERDGIGRAAAGAGYSAQDCADLDAAIQQPRDLESLRLGKLTAVDRVFTYATAVWLARMDGVEDPGEREALRKLGEYLMLSERVIGEAAKTADEVATMPSGSRPDKYDLVALRELVEARILKS